jgi:hypothetical protein
MQTREADSTGPRFIRNRGQAKGVSRAGRYRTAGRLGVRAGRMVRTGRNRRQRAVRHRGLILDT